MAKFDFKKDIQKIVLREMDDYVANKCVPTTSKWIKKNCNKGHATGNLANSVYYDRNSTKIGSIMYTVYVEAFNQKGTNYAVFANNGRGAIDHPRWAKVMVFSDPHCRGKKATSVGPAAGAHFIEDTVKDLKH